MTPPPDLRGAVLGRGYRLAFAVGAEEDAVFEATHERVPGKVVVRLFPNESLSRPDAAARIHQAARLASMVRAPQAIQLLDFNLAGDTPAFVVTERVEGRTLAAVMAADGMLSLPATIDVVEAVASAVHAAHQIGLPHGDLRAPLIIIPDGGGRRAKVGGFGWAKELRAAAVHAPPAGLLAPEQHGGRVVTIDPRADQYGLAALAYEMLAACAPFPEESAGEDREARVPSPLGDLVPGIPHALDDVLRRALSFRTRDRYDDIVEFAARLKEAAATAPITIPLAALPAMAVERVPTMVRRRSSAPMTMPAAQPVSSSATDITEEMDNQTLWPLVAKADGSGDVAARAAREPSRPLVKNDSGGTISSRIQREDSLDLDLLAHAARERAYGSDDYLDIEVAANETQRTPPADRFPLFDATAEAALLEGPPTPAPEVATLVRQSPFNMPAATPPVAVQPAVTPPAIVSPRRASAPYATVPASPPAPRVSASYPTVPTSPPARRASAPYPTAPAKPAARPSAPYATVPAGAPVARPSAPYPTVPSRSRPSPDWQPPVPSFAGQMPAQQPLAYRPYPAQPVEINLGPPAPSWGPAYPQPRAPLHSPPMPYRLLEDSGNAFAGDASAPAFGGSGSWKAALSAVAVVIAVVGGGAMLKNRMALGRGSEATSTPASEARVVIQAPSVMPVASAPIIAPVEGEVADPRSNGEGDCLLRLLATSPSAVWLDGKDTGHRTPLPGFRITCGLHRLLLRRIDTGEERTDIIRVIPGRPFAGGYAFGPNAMVAPSGDPSIGSGPPRALSSDRGARRRVHRARHRRARVQRFDDF